jgi:flagellar hook-length control protein FliK
VSALVSVAAAPAAGTTPAKPPAGTAEAAGGFGDALSLILAAGTPTADAEKQAPADPGSQGATHDPAPAALAAADPAGVAQATPPNFHWPLPAVVDTTAPAPAALTTAADPGTPPEPAAPAGGTTPAVPAAPIATTAPPATQLFAAAPEATAPEAAVRPPAPGDAVPVPRKAAKQTAPTDTSAAEPAPANLAAQAVPTLSSAGDAPAQGRPQSVSVSTEAAAGAPAATAGAPAATPGGATSGGAAPEYAQASAPTAAAAAPAATLLAGGPADDPPQLPPAATLLAGAPSPTAGGVYPPGLPALVVAPGGAAVLPPAAPVPPGFASQLARPIFTLASAGAGSHTVMVAVNPENLGPVTVQAHISAAGVRIELFASNAEGREVLRQSLPDLKRDLTGAGLNASLDLSSDAQPGGQDPRDQFFSRRAASALPHGPDSTQKPANSSAPRASSGLYGIDGALDVMA